MDGVRRDVQDRLRRQTGSFLAERRKKRLAYVELYIKRRGDELKKKEVKELDALEEELSFQDIVFFRCTAIRKLQASKEKVVQRKKRTWGEWLVGKNKPQKAGEDVSEHGDMSEHGGLASPFQNLSKDERDSLIAAAGEDALHHGYGGLMRSECSAQLMFSLTATLESVRLRLIDVSGNLDTTASFSHAALKFAKQSHAFDVEAGLRSFMVRNASNNSTICQQAEMLEGEAGNLMNIAISSDRGVSPAVTSVRVRVASLDLKVDPYVLASLMTFWRIEDPALDVDAAAKFASERCDAPLAALFLMLFHGHNAVCAFFSSDANNCPIPEKRYSDVRGDVSRLVAAQAAASGAAAASEGGEVLELDVDIGAPNLFLHENAPTEVRCLIHFLPRILLVWTGDLCQFLCPCSISLPLTRSSIPGRLLLSLSFVSGTSPFVKPPQVRAFRLHARRHRRTPTASPSPSRTSG